MGWATQLRYFIFMGEVSSGQMDLYEQLQLRLTFAAREELLHVLAELGVLRYGVGDPPSSHVVGGESRVSSHPDLVQPNQTKVAGSACHVWVHSGFIDVTCSAGYRVTDLDVADARRIEAHLDAHALQARVDRGIAKHANAVSVENFPERFAQ